MARAKLNARETSHGRISLLRQASRGAMIEVGGCVCALTHTSENINASLHALDSGPHTCAAHLLFLLCVVPLPVLVLIRVLTVELRDGLCGAQREVCQPRRRRRGDRACPAPE
jgi:hypothetical protein